MRYEIWACEQVPGRWELVIAPTPQNPYGRVIAAGPKHVMKILKKLFEEV